MKRTPQEIADAYLSNYRQKSTSTEWAFDAAYDCRYQKRWDDLWQIILCISRRDEEIETEALAFVAAGPLEDLVCNVGPEFIDRIEHEAKFNRQFGRLLTGVWLSRADPKVAERIIKFCRAFPHPIDEVYGF